MNNFWTRALSGAVYVVLVIGSAMLGLKYFIPLFAFVTAVCLWEFYGNSIPGQPSFRLLGTALGTLLYTVISFSMLGDQSLLRYVPVLAVTPFLLLIWGLFDPSGDAFRNVGYFLLGVVYIVVPFILLPALDVKLHTGAGFTPLLGFFILFWVNDTGAYLTGRAFGKTPLFPRVSPKKTWEGLAGGVALCMLASWVISMFSRGISLQHWMVAGAIIAVFGTLGDLVESMWKRHLGIKDSGNIMPGHGGLMDRFDGFFIAIPVLAFYFFVML